MAKTAKKISTDFHSVSDAFDYAREVNRPVRCTIRGQKVKVYPSGLLERQVNLADVLDFKSRAAGEKDE